MDDTEGRDGQEDGGEDEKRWCGPGQALLQVEVIFLIQPNVVRRIVLKDMSTVSAPRFGNEHTNVNNNKEDARQATDRLTDRSTRTPLQTTTIKGLYECDVYVVGKVLRLLSRLRDCVRVAGPADEPCQEAHTRSSHEKLTREAHTRSSHEKLTSS